MAYKKHIYRYREKVHFFTFSNGPFRFYGLISIGWGTAQNFGRFW